MLQDAELDILRMQPNGNNCVKNSSKPQVCRTSGVLYPPTGAEEIDPLLSKLIALNISLTPLRAKMDFAASGLIHKIFGIMMLF